MPNLAVPNLPLKFLISALWLHTGEAHWHVLLRARAIENQAYVIAAAQAGEHNEKRKSYGHSLIIDPWGVVIAELSDPLATGIAVAHVDLEKISELHTKMPVQQHRLDGLEGVAKPIVNGIQ